MNVFGCLQLLAASASLTAADAAPAARVETFETATPPRVDPVFPDALALRRSIDEFLGLRAEMERVRDAFATSIHETLGKLPERQGPAPSCPPHVAELFRRSYLAGNQYLRLGQKLRELYRDIARAESLGDGIALTPDYRLKAKQAASRYGDLVRDYREMRVAFHDQLATELRYAGCATKTLMGPSAGPEGDAADPEAFELDAPLPSASSASSSNKLRAKPGAPPTTTGAAPAIWITIDNARCPRATKLSIDGYPLGEIPPQRRVSVRTRAGTRELCLLPEGDTRVCGERGTLRRAYLYEGFTVSVHCEAR